ncbi:hypothetical protein [Hartmannibacter diazotrophicus]|uniref:hypothetical protein n=1 Tax=Hartmannibacter diazotrophicus TaxID=1482074 RepID=UPI0012FD6732|nr:hypothetical protein [Hartmannibacter diazotrophicus]
MKPFAASRRRFVSAGPPALAGKGFDASPPFSAEALDSSKHRLPSADHGCGPVCPTWSLLTNGLDAFLLKVVLIGSFPKEA